jgi:hypothetical protein
VPPWSVIEVAEAYCVVDAAGFRLMGAQTKR